jgi:hypothetical protein
MASYKYFYSQKRSYKYLSHIAYHPSITYKATHYVASLLHLFSKTAIIQHEHHDDSTKSC